jgi:NAD(P)-dependent dehydrogenase (short-subunit alcohol dehydrogenase family)
LRATVVCVVRDPRKGEAVINDIKAQGGNPNIDLLAADLASQASIRKLADEFKARYPRLDVLVNSAAVFTHSRRLTSDGLEEMFATNHLGYFLLTNLLLDSLRASAGGRVLNITAPSTVQPNFEDLQGEQRFSALTAFGASKTENLLFTFALARRLEDSGITVNAVHPGIVRTNLMHQAPMPMRMITWFVNFSAVAPERAAEAIVRLATAPEFAGKSGGFYKDAKEIEPPAYACDVNAQQRLWEVSARLTKLGG